MRGKPGGGDARHVGFWACVALVVGNMVGTGVFTSLGFQVAGLPSPPVLLLLWLVGGVIALAGAMSYAELAATIGKSGGEYRFLATIYGPATGCGAGFVSVAVGFAAPVALCAMALGQYTQSILPGVPPKLVSLGAILLLALAHAFSVRGSGRVQATATGVKVGLILLFLALGFSAGNPTGVNFAPRSGDAALVMTPAFGVSLLYVLYAYSGWNAAAYVIGEVRNAGRTVPLALICATLFVVALYTGLNALFLRAVPMEKLDGQLQIGVLAGGALFGDTGGRALAGLIGLGLISSLSAMTWAGPRVAQAMGTDLPWFRALAATSPGGVPHRALLLQTGLACLFLVSGSYQQLLVFTQFALVISSFLAVLGVFVLRRRFPDIERPFRCWGYPFTPALFLAATGMIVVYSVWEQPFEALAGAITFLAGMAIARINPGQRQAGRGAG